MSLNVSQQRIRLALDVTAWTSVPNDAISLSSPSIQNGNDLQFELAFSFGPLQSDANLINPTNWASVTVQLKDTTPRTGNPYWSVTVPTASINAALTFSAW